MSRLFTVRFSFHELFGNTDYDIYFKKTGSVENTGVWSVRSLGGRLTADGYFEHSSKENQIWAGQHQPGIVGAVKCLFTLDLIKDCARKKGEDGFNLRGFKYPCKVGEEGYGIMLSPLFGLSSITFSWKVVA